MTTYIHRHYFKSLLSSLKVSLSSLIEGDRDWLYVWPHSFHLRVPATVKMMNLKQFTEKYILGKCQWRDHGFQYFFHLKRGVILFKLNIDVDFIAFKANQVLLEFLIWSELWSWCKTSSIATYILPQLCPDLCLLVASLLCCLRRSWLQLTQSSLHVLQERSVLVRLDFQGNPDVNRIMQSWRIKHIVVLNN